MSDDDEIVGHKTFQTGPMEFRHEPLTKAEANALWEASEKSKASRELNMPVTKKTII